MDVEEALIGALVRSGSRNAVAKAHVHVRAEDFFDARLGKVYAAFAALFKSGVDPSLQLLVQQLSSDNDLEAVGGVENLVALAESVVNARNVEENARFISQVAVQRFVWEKALLLRAEAGKPAPIDRSTAVEQAASLALQAAERERTKDAQESLIDLARRAVQGIVSPSENIVGSKVSSGYRTLDGKLNGGFAPGGFYVVAGRPSMGKSTLAMNIAERVLETGKRVGIVTVETRASELMENLVYSRARVPAGRVGGDLNDNAVRNLTKAGGEIAKLNLEIADGPRTMLGIRVKTMLWSALQPLDLLIVDYLQLIAPSKTDRAPSRQQEVSEMSAALKSLAHELKCPLLAVSQLNRSVEQREDRRPRMSDLRDSGSIEQDADAIFLLYRPDYYAGPGGEVERVGSSTTQVAEVNVAKNRRGATGTETFTFRPAYLRFEDQLSEWSVPS